MADITGIVEKERLKAEKAKKFAEKQAKKAALAAATTKNATKKKVAAKEEIKPYVEETPKGEKKSKTACAVNKQARHG